MSAAQVTYSYARTAGKAHQVTGTTGAVLSSYAYDAAGNTTSRTIGGVTQSLTWTPQGKLAKVTVGTTVLSRWVHAPDGSVLEMTV